ncbi:hypothetical protein EBZ38_06775 [bacterium]|nr:hypothetical protein [bacterium]
MLPLYEIPFGIKTMDNTLSKDTVNFQFINSKSDAVPIVEYRSNPSESDLWYAKEMNYGVLNPVVGVNALKTPLNQSLSIKDGIQYNEKHTGIYICPPEKIYVGSLNQSAGNFNYLGSLQIQGQQLGRSIPSALDDTTSNAFKNRSTARVQGDTNLNSGFTNISLAEDSQLFTDTKEKRKKRNSIERFRKLNVSTREQQTPLINNIAVMEPKEDTPPGTPKRNVAVIPNEEEEDQFDFMF